MKLEKLQKDGRTAVPEGSPRKTESSRRLLLCVPWILSFLGALTGCGPSPKNGAPVEAATREALPELPPPSILLITLDTTRADRLGFEFEGIETPHLDALAARGQRFPQAYATAPMTLPSHASMMTGLYPSEHGIHENARSLGEEHPHLAEELGKMGYRTAAFVSGYPLSRQFGIGRGFEVYGDDLEGAAERRGRKTTEKALAFLSEVDSKKPLFLWVHYFDPHEPYEPEEPYRSAYPKEPYLGEIAAMDAEVGRLMAAFEGLQGGRPIRFLVVGDHGEGLGEHGETLHGNLLYQGTMRVPLILAGDGIEAGVRPEAVSVRRVFDTVLQWAGQERAAHLGSGTEEVVLGEAMKPLLQYGWQPQVMAVRGNFKAIRSGDLEVFDLVQDPKEGTNLVGEGRLPRELRQAVRDYPLPGQGEGKGNAAASGGSAPLSQEDAQRLASLGYTQGQARAPFREDAPSPKDQAHLFADLDRGSGLFVRQEYRQAIGVFEGILAQDPNNLVAALRLAVANSALGRNHQAETFFQQARRIAPASADVRHYEAMHLLGAGGGEDAAALFESVLVQEPRRLTALEALAGIREKQGRWPEAATLLMRAIDVSPEPAPLQRRLGDAFMAQGQTVEAIRAFEAAQLGLGSSFARNLELGVLYMANRRLDEARLTLDQVPPSHPAYPMALFKRAQVSVLLAEPDAPQRIALARRRADATTAPLIEREALFRSVRP